MFVPRLHFGVTYLKCKYFFKLSICKAIFPFSLRTMNSIDSSHLAKDILMPPPIVYGMKKLDREAFKKEIEIPAVDIPIKDFKIFKNLKPYLLKMIKLQPVQGDEKVKKILLNPLMLHELLQNINLNNIYWTKITLSYENFNHESIFKAIIPPDIGGNVSSFSIIGHIIHLNLKEELLDYKYLVGEVLLDKFHNIKTVVNKIHTIDTEYRHFQMELLAGEPNYEVTVKENGFQYMFDFSKVFWNPRLVHEHGEIVKKTAPGDMIFDVFAGVGPFAIPLAKKKCIVHANDLNPDSHKWLNSNAKLNNVSEFLTTYNLDGREFIKTVVKKYLIKHWNECNKSSVHILMNLPACALDFLDAFQGLLKDQKFNGVDMPFIYCYFFLKKEEEAATVIQKYFDEDFLKCVTITTVRNVAPNKRMMRLTYKVPPSVLFQSDDLCKEPVSKRIKLSF